jgi:hypothetical protein
MVADLKDYRRTSVPATPPGRSGVSLVGAAMSSVASNRMAPWLLGRAAGVTSYLLIVALVGFGLFLSHPAAGRIGRPGRAVRLRVHVSLAVFTLAFTTLHIVVLATDRYAGVGWRGALVPGLASYRPLPVTLGVIGLYAGLLAGVTAATAGRLAGRVWWPIHKVAVISLVLVWVHGVLSGSDTPTLLVMYLATGAGVIALAITRYAARTPADEVEGRLRQVPAAGSPR